MSAISARERWLMAEAVAAFARGGMSHGLAAQRVADWLSDGIADGGFVVADQLDKDAALATGSAAGVGEVVVTGEDLGAIALSSETREGRAANLTKRLAPRITAALAAARGEAVPQEVRVLVETGMTLAPVDHPIYKAGRAWLNALPPLPPGGPDA